jgi:hypothetical protein
MGFLAAAAASLQLQQRQDIIFIVQHAEQLLNKRF